MPRCIMKVKKQAINELNSEKESEEKKAPLSVFDDNEFYNLIKINLFDPWDNTPFKGYVYLDPKQKGIWGEVFVSKFMIIKGYKVDNTKENNGPYDRYISSKQILSEKYSMIPTEIKFSLAQKDSKTNGIKKNIFIINHIGLKKQWERLIFVCINGENEKDWLIKWFRKVDFENYLKNNTLFKQQQGGKNGGNDDWMCSGPNTIKLMKELWVYDITDWSIID